MTCHFFANRVAGQAGHFGRAKVSKLWYVKVMVRKTDTRGAKNPGGRMGPTQTETTSRSNSDPALLESIQEEVEGES